MSLELHFPYKQLDRTDFQVLTELAGGSPVTRENLDGFFAHIALPMLRDGLARALIDMAAQSCSPVLDDNVDRCKRMYYGGALLYTAVLAECSPLSRIPCKPKVYMELIDTEEVDVIHSANQRITDEVTSFCKFMDEVAAEALELETPNDIKSARVGAGLIHIMTTDSLRPEEIDDFELEHPELADLEQIFRSYDGRASS